MSGGEIVAGLITGTILIVAFMLFMWRLNKSWDGFFSRALHEPDGFGFLTVVLMLFAWATLMRTGFVMVETWQMRGTR